MDAYATFGFFRFSIFVLGKKVHPLPRAGLSERLTKPEQHPAIVLNQAVCNTPTADLAPFSAGWFSSLPMPSIKELPPFFDEDGQHTARMQADEVREIAAVTIQALWRSCMTRRAVQAWLHLIAEYHTKLRRGIDAEPPVPLAEWHFAGTHAGMHVSSPLCVVSCPWTAASHPPAFLFLPLSPHWPIRLTPLPKN